MELGRMGEEQGCCTKSEAEFCTVGGEGVCVLHADGVVQVWSNL